jgi:hypothetical protein
MRSLRFRLTGHTEARTDSAHSHRMLIVTLRRAALAAGIAGGTLAGATAAAVQASLVLPCIVLRVALYLVG